MPTSLPGSLLGKRLEARVPLDPGFSPGQVQPAMTRMITALRFQDAPLTVQWVGPQHGRIMLPPFGYRNFTIDVRLEEAGGGPSSALQVHLRSQPMNAYRCPLMFRREVRALWDTIVERVRLLS